MAPADDSQDILVVTGDPVISHQLCAALERHGLHAHPAFTCRQARQTAQCLHPDLVVADLGMFSSEGDALCRDLRRTGGAPVVLVCDGGSPAAIASALAAGATDYLIRPLRDAEVAERVRTQLTLATAAGVPAGIGTAPGDSSGDRETGTAKPARATAGGGRMATREDDPEREMLERQLRHSQKLEAVGTLAGGIAHDFNNMLQAIRGYAELAVDAAEGQPHLIRFLKRIEDAAGRATALVRQILTFSRQTEQPATVVELRPLLKEALKFLRASIPTTIEIASHVAPGNTAVVADATQLHQVVMNLCTNAYHAMRDTGGLLEVSLGEVAVDPEMAARTVGLKPGPYVEIRVRDTGKGIDEKILDRIFEPFFTTKEPNEGTGMGLATVHGIVSGCGGVVTVESNPGKGATFTVLLPAHEDDLGETALELENARHLTGSEHVLVVDDEESLVTMASEGLRRLGYRTSTFTDAIAALAAVQNTPDAHDVLVVDLTMPRMTGLELAEVVRALRPEMPIVLWSGSLEEAERDRGMALGIREFLLKPIPARELAAAVRRAVSGGSACDR